MIDQLIFDEDVLLLDICALSKEYFNCICWLVRDLLREFSCDLRNDCM